MSLDETGERRLPRLISWPLVFVFSGIFWWFILSVLFGSCSAPPPPSGPFAASRLVSVEEALQPSLWPLVRSLVVAPAEESGNVRRMFAGSACRPRRGDPLPYIFPQLFPPRAGQEWRCRFVTSVIGPEPDVDLWIVLSTTPPVAGLPAELTPIGMPGCLLQVNPEMLVHVPRGGLETPMLSRESGRGRVLLRWTPPAGASGMSVWVQCMVASPSTPAGFLLSYAIELTVGS